MLLVEPVYVEIPTSDSNVTKVIQLMPKFNIPKKKEPMLSEASQEYDYSDGIKPIEHDLGMSNVPVLDQGQYGTCVTFSSTAALDARYNMGDRIDQQCTLALSKTLGGNYWNGAYTPSQLIDPLVKYGYIEKGRCFGFNYPFPSQTVNIRKYKASSTSLFTKYVYVGEANLDKLKDVINKGSRVLIGFNIGAYASPTGVIGYNVKVDGVSKVGGLWACKQPGKPENNCINPTGGHEVLVTGYDDSQKLLKIRNSWGYTVGDNGEFYMTYEYFFSQVKDMTIIL